MLFLLFPPPSLFWNAPITPSPYYPCISAVATITLLLCELLGPELLVELINCSFPRCWAQLVKKFSSSLTLTLQQVTFHRCSHGVNMLREDEERRGAQSSHCQVVSQWLAQRTIKYTLLILLLFLFLCVIVWNSLCISTILLYPNLTSETMFLNFKED